MKLVPLVLMLVVLLAVPTPAVAEGETPTYTVGDYWRYSIESPQMTGTLNTSIAGTRQVTVGATTFTVWNGLVSGSGNYDDGTYAGPIVMSGYSYFDTTTMKTVKESLTLDMTVTPKSGGGSSVNQKISSTQTYDPPLEYQKYPVAVGNSWPVACEILFRTELTVDGSAPPGYPSETTIVVNTTFNVQSKLSKTVPAGTFEVFVIKNETMEIWYSDVVGSSIKIVDNRPGNTQTYELLSYRYAGPAVTPPTPNTPAGGFLPADAGIATVAAAALVAIAVRSRGRGVRPSIHSTEREE